VLSLWAITIVVIPYETSSKVAYMSFSFVLSKALVASSNNNSFGFFSKALAIATLYFWPPLN